MDISWKYITTAEFVYMFLGIVNVPASVFTCSEADKSIAINNETNSMIEANSTSSKYWINWIEECQGKRSSIPFFSCCEKKVLSLVYKPDKQNVTENRLIQFYKFTNILQ